MPTEKIVYVLDTSVIVRSPSFLAFKSPTARVAIPKAVYEELGGRDNRRAHSVAGLLGEAISRGAVEVIQPSNDQIAALAQTDVPARLSGADIDLWQLGLSSEPGATQYRIVSDDRDLARALAARGVQSLTSEEFEQVFSDAGAAPDRLVAGAAELYVRSERNWFLWVIVVAVLSVCAVDLAFRIGAAALVRAASPVWIAAGTLALGIGFFQMRLRFQPAYGVAEVWIGVTTAWYTFENATSQTQTQTLAVALPFAGALYIIVRGLDNFAKGIENTRFEPSWWKRYFRKL